MEIEEENSQSKYSQDMPDDTQKIKESCKKKNSKAKKNLKSEEFESSVNYSYKVIQKLESQPNNFYYYEEFLCAFKNINSIAQELKFKQYWEINSIYKKFFDDCFKESRRYNTPKIQYPMHEAYIRLKPIMIDFFDEIKYIGNRRSYLKRRNVTLTFLIIISILLIKII